MQTIQASEFRARCLALLDSVATDGEPLVVMKNGRPVAELLPDVGERCDSPFGLHRNLRITGDIISPAAENDWEVSA